MFQNIDNKQFKELLKRPNTVVMDVRTPKEIAEGYIPQATIFADINENATFEAVIRKLDKSKTYLLYCRSGARSSRACKLNGGGRVQGATVQPRDGYYRLGWREKSKPLIR